MGNRCLGIDPGAKRLGYAVVSQTDAGYSLEESGVVTLAQGLDEKWGEYRRRLIEHWCKDGVSLLARTCELEPWHCYSVAFELQPPFGMSGVQQQLAKTVRDCLQTICEMTMTEWQEFAPITIKKNVTGITGRKKISKVDVRNGVIKVFPELESRKKELTEVAEESDAIAIALVGLGYKVGSTTPSVARGAATLPRV